MKIFSLKNKLYWALTLSLILLVAAGAIVLQPKPTETPLLENDFLLGDYYFNHGPSADGTYNLVLARKYYTRALKYNPRGDNWAWYQLGRIDFLEGRFNDALHKFDKQIEYFGDIQPSVYYMIALTHGYRARMYNQVEDWKLAEENFLHYLEFDSDSPWARTDLAWIYFSQGKYEEMFEPLRVGLEKTPDNPWLLNMYGLALLNTDSKEEARKNFLKAKEMADKITTEEWGASYPGNDPGAWPRGLKEFRQAIETNLDLAS